MENIIENERTVNKEKVKTSKGCSVENCNNTHYAKGYCNKHYKQIRKHGKLTPEKERRKYNIICKVDYCNEISNTKGYCNKHYQQILRLGRLLPKKESKCSFDDCNNKIYKNGNCLKHHKQILLRKKIDRLLNRDYSKRREANISDTNI